MLGINFLSGFILVLKGDYIKVIIYLLKQKHYIKNKTKEG